MKWNEMKCSEVKWSEVEWETERTRVGESGWNHD
jgi:hypothetical protein